MMDTHSSSGDSQQDIVPNEFDDLVPVKLSRVEEVFVDRLNDHSAISEVRPPPMPAWARSEATFQAWTDDLSQTFEPLSEVNEERSDAVLSQPDEPLHEVHQKSRVAALSKKFEPLPEMPTSAHSEATIQAWSEDLLQKFEPLPEANEVRSDAVSSQPIEPLHEVHQKSRVATLSKKFEPVPDANEAQPGNLSWLTLEPLPDAEEEQRDAVLSQTFEPLPDAPDVDLSQKSDPQSEANKEQSDDVQSQNFEPLPETHEKPSVTTISLCFEPSANTNANANAVQSEVITLRQRLTELSSILTRTNEEEEKMDDDYLLFDAVETCNDSLLPFDEEPNDLPFKPDKKQGQNIFAAPEENPHLKADVISEESLLDAVEGARNDFRQVGAQHNKYPGHAEDRAISYEIDQDDNSIIELGEGPHDSHLEDDEEPVDPLLGVVVESDHPRFADVEDDEYFLVGVEEASDYCLGTDAREYESFLDANEAEDHSLLDNDDDDESLLDEDGDDSLLDADERLCDLDSLAEILDSGTAVVKTTVFKGLKGLANQFKRESGLPYPEYLKPAKKSNRGKKTRGLQAADDDREPQGKTLVGTLCYQHNQSDSLHNLHSGGYEKDSTIMTVDSQEMGSRSAASSPSVQTDANSAKPVPTPKGKDIFGETEKKTTMTGKRVADIIRMLENGDEPPEFRKQIPTKRRPNTSVLDSDDARFLDITEVRGVDKELNNVDLRSNHMRPPKQREEELSSPRAQSILETREPPPPTTLPPRRHDIRCRSTIVKVVARDNTTSSADFHDYEESQLPTPQQEEVYSSIKKDLATIEIQPKPTYYWSEPPPPPPPPPTMNFYSSQPPPTSTPHCAPSVLVKPERATEKAVVSEEPHHKQPEINYVSIKSVTGKSRDQQRPISRASQFPLQRLPRRSGHMGVKTNHDILKTDGFEVKSVPHHRRPDPPCDDRNDAFAGREEMSPIARMRLFSKRSQLM